MTKFPMEDEEQQIAVTVPLFLRKLWKMVNDHEAEDIIGWNSTGDGFVIYDQLQFITTLLPKYFKHNNLASFIRQLNFYDFHKVSGIDKDEIQFTHSCFLKDLPQTLVFIHRKCTSLRSKLPNNLKDEELSEILSGVKELKTKHSLVDNELKLLKQENAALWNEVNNLRLKHAKQTKIINKIIHFLISYMHSHQNSLPKGKISVDRKNNQKMKSGPTILEIDYHDSPDSIQKKVRRNSYTITEPGYSGAITYPSPENFSNMQSAEHTLDEILDNVTTNINENEEPNQLIRANTEEHSGIDMLQNSQNNLIVDIKPNISKEINLSSDSLQEISKKSESTQAGDGIYSPLYKKRKTSVPNSAEYNILQNPKDNLGMYIDNTQVELNSLQDILNNLSTAQLTDFCNLIEESAADSPTTEGSNSDETSDQHLKNSLAEELATLPMEPNAMTDILSPDNVVNEEYNIDNTHDIEPEVLVDEYFSI